jgi:hypothetical protein
MKTFVRCALCLSLLPATVCIAADVPTFESGEYRVTTSFGDKERGCNLVAAGQEDSVYRYLLDCTNGTTGALAVTKLSESHFESRAEVELPIGGFTQTISMRDVATRIGECPPE